MNKAKRLSHALHNESLCKLLFEGGVYNDWVITTAYYSAHHFVSYTIFPYTHTREDGSTVDLRTLDEYYSYFQCSNGKHNELANMVWDNFPAISPEYDWLKDMCMTARYKNYFVSKADAERAYKLLATIKAAINIPQL